MNEHNFVLLSEHLAHVDLFGVLDPAVPPWGKGRPQIDAAQTAVEAAVGKLPFPYGSAYIDPLRRRLPNLVGQDSPNLETLVGAVWQHADDFEFAPHLRRFLAVISDLFLSFLDATKRARIHIAFREAVPPLAAFRYSGNDGPFTIPVDQVSGLTGGRASVVSLPATYADHPIIWVPLAHEAGGHDVAHADSGLLEELQAGVGTALQGISMPDLGTRDLGVLWAHWMDEAVADIYGLLNVGPAFGYGFAAFMSAYRSKRQGGGLPIPKVSMETVSSDDGPLNVHPTDILRIHLAIGAIESLKALAKDTADGYIADLSHLAILCASGDSIELAGYAFPGRFNATPFNVKTPLREMQESARRVGRYIATAKLDTLDGHSIQEIETWDDDDEAHARAVQVALEGGRPIAALGDDAQLLAGAVLRLLEDPEVYPDVNRALRDGLDESFADDPIWSAMSAKVDLWG